MPTTFDKYSDVIDSRDIIARIEELEDLFSEHEISEENGAEVKYDDEERPIVDLAICGTCGKAWNDALVTSSTPTPSGRCPYEHIHEELEELKHLLALQEEAEGYADDWGHGVTLIRDSYFRDYAQELAEDIGAMPKETAWPAYCIDWDYAARELQMDYTSVEFDGVTYWVR